MEAGGTEAGVSAGTGAGAGTLARGLSILRLFGPDQPQLTQSRIAEALGLPLPTVHRLCTILVAEGFLSRPRGERQLQLGDQIARLAGAAPPGPGTPGAVRAALRSAAAATGESANLATFVHGEVVYLDSVAGTHLLGPRAEAGLRVPAHCTALGKSFLAQLADAEALRILGKGPYPRRTAATHTSWASLRTDLAEIRRTGLAVSVEEYEIGLVSLAIALPATPDGRQYAINVSLPSSRATDLPAVERVLRSAAAGLG